MAVNKKAKKKEATDIKKKSGIKLQDSGESLFYEYRHEISFVSMSALSMILFLANLGLIGPIGKVVKSVSFGLFGFFAWIFPFLLFFSITIWMANRENSRVRLKIWLSLAVFLLLSSLSELISYPNVAKMSFKDLYLYSAERGNGGGFIGGLFAKYLAGGLALIGAYIVLITLLVILVIFLTGRFFINPIKRRAEETKNHLVELKNEQLEEARRRAEIKSELRKEARILKREERERAREERIQKLREVKLIDDEKKDILKKENYFHLESNKKTGKEDQDFLKEEESEKSEERTSLKEIGSPKTLNLSAILNREEEKIVENKEDGEETIYRSILENKFGKEVTSEKEWGEAKLEHPAVGRPSPSWSLVETCEDGVSENEQTKGSFYEEELKENTAEENSLEEYAEEENSLEEYTAEEQLVRDSSFDIKATPKVKVEDDIEKGFPLVTIKENRDFMEVASEEEVLERDDSEAEVSEEEILEYETFLDEEDFEEDEENSKEELNIYSYPPVNLLTKPDKEGEGVSELELQETADKLQKTLEAFGVRAKVTDVSCGPSVTRYELQPEIGVKVSKITSLSDDIKLNLAAADIRIEAPIPGKAAVGIEVPNKTNTMVYFRELIESKEFSENTSKLSFAVGKDIAGKTMVTDIAKMPHLLIAGATGSGKSVCINTLIMSILYKARADEVKFIMIDPKVVELSCYNGIPHLLLPVVTDPKKAAAALNWAVAEMNRRYTLFAEEGVRNIKGFNKAIGAESLNWLPQIVIIVDELADLMMVSSKDVEEAICRLAQLARAAGIHLVIATQRPSVNVITGLIKANIPSRIAFAVSSQVDSRTILDGAGAEKLLGKGDMLFFPSGYPKPVRVQGAFVSDNEVADLVDFLREHNGESHKGEDISEAVNQVAVAESLREISEKSQIEESGDDYDEYFDEAGKFIIEKQKASIGMLQRVYRIGFNRAARIMDQLAEAGVVSEEDGTRARKILMSKDEFLQFLAFRHGEDLPASEEEI